MTTSAGNRWDAWPRAAAVRVDPDSIWVRLVDGRELHVPFEWLGFLDARTPEERADIQISGHGDSLWWETIDEEASVPSLLGLPEVPPPDPSVRSYTVDYSLEDGIWMGEVRDTHLGAIGDSLAATQRAVRSNLARYHRVRSLKRVGIEVIDVVPAEAVTTSR
jgi:hypothetical protein